MRTQETTTSKSARKLTPTRKATGTIAKASAKTAAPKKPVRKSASAATAKKATRTSSKASLKADKTARKTPLKASRVKAEKETSETEDSKSLTMQPKMKLSRKGDARFREEQQRESMNDVNPAKRH